MLSKIIKILILILLVYYAPTLIKSRVIIRTGEAGIVVKNGWKAKAVGFGAHRIYVPEVICKYPAKWGKVSYLSHEVSPDELSQFPVGSVCW